MILLYPSPDLLNCRLRARRFGHHPVPQIRAVQRCREEHRPRGVRRCSYQPPGHQATQATAYNTGREDDIPRPSQMGGRRRILSRSGRVLVLSVAVCFVSDLLATHEGVTHHRLDRDAGKQRLEYRELFVVRTEIYLALVLPSVEDGSGRTVAELAAAVGLICGSVRYRGIVASPMTANEPDL
jgi:hypothetical protein